ncbi:MAG TPA: FAD-dependent oxidoreductase [Longimicrobiaceae bacterium]|nr:FAD-dependent oxidoreductase [Longimicrobiaceae bacterium]
MSPTDPAAETLHARCCVVGGGPAGMMLGFLLARAGVEVVVLEKHADFLRDFRGDTIHPSTMQVMYELGLLPQFLQRPHAELKHVEAEVGTDRIRLADFSHLPTRCRFVAFMPQWDFLDFLKEHASRYPTFELRMEAEVTELVREGDRVVGVRATTPGGPLEVRADLVVGADGRSSIVRERAGLDVQDVGAPMDVLWMRISRRESDPDQSLGRLDNGAMLILLDRGDYWQCAFVIPKGSWDEVRERGLPAFRVALTRIAPFLADRVDELRDWDDVKLLTVRVDRLRRWYRPGVLCIGDAAHAMSPIGGVGINLAVQDAIATANLLARPLREGRLTEEDLAAVQDRRELPARLTQRLQVFLQNRVIRRALAADDAAPISLPRPMRLLLRLPWVQHMAARAIGLGFRPEHVRTEELS